MSPVDPIHLAPGDPTDQAIAALFDAYGSRLFRTGLRLCGSSADAEDMVQETFLNAYRAWPSYRGEGSAAGWLFRIAANACHRLHRGSSPKVGGAPSLDGLLPFGDPALAVVPEAPLDRVAEEELRDTMQEAVAHLPAEYRLPLVFKDLIGLTTEEAAQALDLKPATLRTRVHRARLMLRQAIAHRLPRAGLAPAAYPKQICMDLLETKQQALDGGRPFPVGNEVVCERCRAVFETLDLGGSLCADLAPHATCDGLRTFRFWLQ